MLYEFWVANLVAFNGAVMRELAIEFLALAEKQSATGQLTLGQDLTPSSEDDAMIGGLLAETLEGLGHAVCAMESNVAKAVAAASHWRPDLMIVDVGLGEASGIAAVKEILRSGRCIERRFVGTGHRPHSKSLPRIGPRS